MAEYLDADGLKLYHENLKPLIDEKITDSISGKVDLSLLDAHKTNKNNPHGVTKTQVGLGNVDNTSDTDKPISAATQSELNKKLDKSHEANKNNPHGVTKAQIGLGNADNTSDVNKPVSTATQAELNKKLDKTGGTISNANYAPLVIERAGSPYFAGIKFKNSLGVLGSIAQGAVDGPLVRSNASANKQYPILDSTNYADYALPKAGGDLTGDLTIPCGKAIIGKGSKAAIKAIQFVDNSVNDTGNGVIVCGGGLTMLGSGESSYTVRNGSGATGGDEHCYVTSDSFIKLLVGQQNGYEANKGLVLDNAGNGALSGKLTAHKLELTSMGDVEGTSNTTEAAPLIIGAKTGVHLEIDSNEIAAKSNTNTPSSLYINNNGGGVTIPNLYVNGSLDTVGANGIGVISRSTGIQHARSNAEYTTPTATARARMATAQDKNKKWLACVEYINDTNNNNCVYISATKPHAASDTWVTLFKVGFDANDNIFSYVPTPATADNSTKIATTAFVKNQKYVTALSVYPVGAIYLSVNSTSPASLFGGTWMQISQGRVLIGQGSNGTTTYSNAATGGAEKITLTANNIPSHRHTIPNSEARQFSAYTYNSGTPKNGVTTSTENSNILSGIGGGGGRNYVRFDIDPHNHGGYTGYNGSGAAVDIRQPYLVVYMWKRTA